MSVDRDQRSAHDRAARSGEPQRAFTPGKHTNTALLEGGSAPTPAAPGRRTATEALPAVGSPTAALGAQPASDGEASHHMEYRPDGVGERRTIPAAGKGGGNPLPAPVRAQMEAALGVDFSAVRIHEGGAADEVDAHGYTQGTDIHFAPGRYDPHSSEGLALLGHELTHVVQQSQGRVGATLQMKGSAINEDSALEREADAHGTAAARGEQVGSIGGGVNVFSGDNGQGKTNLLEAIFGAPSSVIQRQVRVNPVTSSRHNKLALLGDGTPANPGLTIGDLDAYVTRQADWFSESSLARPDRDAVWKVLLLLRRGPHMLEALRPLRTSAVAALGAADINKLTKYATCFDSAAQTIQVSTRRPHLPTPCNSARRSSISRRSCRRR